MATIEQVLTDDYVLYLGDCCEVMAQLKDESVHFSIYSPPFAGLYHYSSSPRDLSNSRNYQEFLDHYEFVISEIHRLTKPGRITAVHCMDIPLGNTGRNDLLMDFPGDIIGLHCQCRDPNCTAPDLERRKGLCGHGWFGHVARYHVWKEPLGVRNRTMAKKLAHQTIVEDSSRCGVASADYLLVFRREGENKEPIEHPHGLTEYAGERQIPPELLKFKNWDGKQIENQYSHWIWRQYASAFWDDVRIDRVLPFQESRGEDDEKHVHPLQLDVIDRAIVLWSNPGDTVLTPFMGVGSEVYAAVRNGRRGIGVELKPTYFRQAVKNLETVEKAVEEPTLFDWAAQQQEVPQEPRQ
jgi:DNA modification methylase